MCKSESGIGLELVEEVAWLVEFVGLEVVLESQLEFVDWELGVELRLGLEAFLLVVLRVELGAELEVELGAEL